MRFTLLATTMVALPLTALAQSQCALPLPVTMAAEPIIQLPSPITVGEASVPLMPSVAAGPSSTPSNPAWPATPAVAEPSRRAANIGPIGTALASADIKASPALTHIAAAGASLFDLGQSHGLHTVYARNGSQVMVFAVAPDGQATVAGLMTDLSVEQLQAIGGKNITELPVQHGLRALFLHNGPQFQVFYATQDDERLIPGVMWDSGGKDLTRDLVASIPGTVPTVAIGDDTPLGAMPASAPSPAIAHPSLLAIARGTTHGSIGNASAPELWMFVDPQCSFSVQAMQQLAPSIASGKIHLNLIPLSYLDREDNGMSTRAALNLVSMPSNQLVAAWKAGRTTGTPPADALAKLQANMAAASAMQLRGTPTFIWRKADGTAGRLDGIPSDMNALLASVGS